MGHKILTFNFGECEKVFCSPYTGMCEDGCTDLENPMNGKFYVCDCNSLEGYELGHDNYSCIGESTLSNVNIYLKAEGKISDIC